MGPKNVAATCASVPQQKDLSWIDRMYMKFETMCVEVDKNPSLLLQETSKYVESQVNAVGANVKKLCTELIQDLISTPMLSSEGVEKKLECALHCKCHCMDSERCGTDTAGFEGGNESSNDTVFLKQDIGKKEFSKAETLNVDITTEQQKSTFFEVCGAELNNIHGEDRNNNGEEPNTAVGHFGMEETGSHKTFEEKLGLTKVIPRCEVQKGDSSGKFEVNCKYSEKEENRTVCKESMRGIEVAACSGGIVSAEQAKRPNANGDKETKSINGWIETYRNNAIENVLGSQEDKWQPQVLDFLHDLRARNIEGLLKWQGSDVVLKNVLDRERESHINSDAIYAKCKYDTTSSAMDLQTEEVKETMKEGSSFQSMYNCKFSDPPRSRKDEEAMIVPEFCYEGAYDEEQSARWLVGEDLRKALQPEIVGIEQSRHGECFLNEFDLDWELL